MAMGRQEDRQGELMVMWSEMPRSPGHVFYDRLQEVLVGAGFDGFVEDACRAYYAKTTGGTPHRLASGFSEVWGSLAGKVWIEDGLGLEHGAGHADEAIGD